VNVVKRLYPFHTGNCLQDCDQAHEGNEPMAAARSKLLPAAAQLCRLGIRIGVHDGLLRQLRSLAGAPGTLGTLQAPSLQRPFSSEPDAQAQVNYFMRWCTPELRYFWVFVGAPCRRRCRRCCRCRCRRRCRRRRRPLTAAVLLTTPCSRSTLTKATQQHKQEPAAG